MLMFVCDRPGPSETGSLPTLESEEFNTGFLFPICRVSLMCTRKEAR